MDNIIPSSHSKVVKIPKHNKELKQQPEKYSSKSRNKERLPRKQQDDDIDNDSDESDNDEDTSVSDESEKTDTASESDSEEDIKTSNSKNVKQKHRRIKRTHNPNVEFTENPSEKDLKNVLMKEIDEELDLNRRLSRKRRKRLSKKLKEKSLKESFKSKLRHVKESFHKKTILIPIIIIVVLCVISGIAYYINKKHPGFFKRIKETITRKKHSEKTEKIFN